MKLAVIGAGVMGGNHARIASRLRGVELTWVADPDQSRARALGDALGVRWAAKLPPRGEVDAAVVAIPTDQHVDVARKLLADGVHLLVEKPLAPTSAEARRIVCDAREQGLTLMVGHVERFNPAVLGLASILDDVLHVSTARISPYSDRVRDDVVIDLMIHDLDLVLSLTEGRLVEVSSVGSHVRSSSRDIAAALLVFDNGVTASLFASRVGQHKIRRVEITQRDSFVTADLLRHDVEVSRVMKSEYISGSGTRYRQSGMIEIPFLEQQGEPLALELGHFVECVATGGEPIVPGEAGVAALEAVEFVMEVGSLSTPVNSARTSSQPSSPQR